MFLNIQPTLNSVQLLHVMEFNVMLRSRQSFVISRNHCFQSQQLFMSHFVCKQNLRVGPSADVDARGLNIMYIYVVSVKDPG